MASVVKKEIANRNGAKLHEYLKACPSDPLSPAQLLILTIPQGSEQHLQLGTKYSHESRGWPLFDFVKTWDRTAQRVL